MDNELSEIFRPFKYLFIILMIEGIILFSFFSSLFSSYDKNMFEIKLNGTLMNCYYSENYNKAFLIQTGSSGYNSVEPSINNIDLKDYINLEIKEYEVYYKSGTRKTNTNNWYREDDLVYKDVSDIKMKLQIKRMNKVIYEGDYTNDLSKYLNEQGRYYFHIYSTRKEDILTSVKTHISFNVIVGGGNHE